MSLARIMPLSVIKVLHKKMHLFYTLYKEKVVNLIIKHFYR
nr:MAG TPA: DASH complex subunit Dad3 [Caudoviricetes sp.]